MLPAPQISDQELDEIAKMGYASDLVSGSEGLDDGSGATRALLANYNQTPRQGMTPLRTPQRTPSGKGDAIMLEAENLARLRESQTPLLGGENPELHPSDFSGVTPKKREIQTPNPMATPLSTPGPMGLTPRIGMTPANDGYSFGMTPKGTPMRDELHINEDMDMLDNAKLELRRQAELRRNLRSGLTSLPQPKNEYQIVVQPVPEENEEPEDRIEEDMSDRIAREKAEEEARQQALLRKRSKVLQRELPRPPAASLELIKSSLMRADEDKSSFVPPTSIEQADEMIRKELLTLLEHDNAKYPLDEKAVKEKKKGSKRGSNGKSAVAIPEIEDVEEDLLKEADSMINEEVDFLRVAMGHENESLDDFVKAHDACQEDLMYFPTRNAYGLSSVAGNMEKLAALQIEFEKVKNRMDDETKKAIRLEQKINLLTHGYQMRAGKIWSQIEATFKQIDTAGTELECFQALQRQEQLAATYRINGLVEEITKQRDLEKNLQQRYGNLVSERERIQRLVEAYRLQAQLQEEIEAKNRAEEIAAKNRALVLSESAADQGVPVETKLAEPVASSEDLGNSISVDQSQPEAPICKEDASREQATHASREEMDADKQLDSVTSMDVDVNAGTTEEEKAVVVPSNNHDGPTPETHIVTTNDNKPVPITVTPVGGATENGNPIPKPACVEVMEMTADSSADKVVGHLDENINALNNETNTLSEYGTTESKIQEADHHTVAEARTEGGGTIIKPGESQEQMIADLDGKTLNKTTVEVSGAETTTNSSEVASTLGGDEDLTPSKPSDMVEKPIDVVDDVLNAGQAQAAAGDTGSER